MTTRQQEDATQADDTTGAVRAALRIMGMEPQAFELTLFPGADLGPVTTTDRVLSVRRLPLGEPRLYLVATEVPWLMQLVGDLCEGRL